MAPNAFDRASSTSSMPVMKNGWVVSIIQTKSMKMMPVAE
eukprot:CAMPEP_0201884734 /NCGR_PEP_ID=MMETSP0902-20130614/17526_1 /ASSEMBLY_ACC=CAM_ASM_000551 /TAXON_ID=420261 /ORGANISM="Thalassiosira antarctica, Strain CCMP982" /LENGTH=39 /DNA_ID= /DNA_START= /DNA_END= /DNA_ORIENTATION=